MNRIPAFRISKLAGLLLLIVFGAGTAVASDPLTPTSDFLDLPDGHFGGWSDGISSPLPPLTIDGVTFSFSPSGPSGHRRIGLTPQYSRGHGSDPSDACSFGKPFSGPPETTIDFDTPLAAFGVTFLMDDGVLEVYDGPGASGNLLGTIHGTPPAPPWSESNRPVDFVALMSDQRNIRSARLFGLSDCEEYKVTGLAYSVVPEPSTIVLLCMGAFGLLARGWRRRQ